VRDHFAHDPIAAWSACRSAHRSRAATWRAPSPRSLPRRRAAHRRR
jgi:hypothetical protein